MGRNFLAAASGAAFLLTAGAANAGVLYALDNGNDTLVAIDTLSLAVSTVGTLGTNVSFGGLAYDPYSDTMYMVGGRNNNNLFTLDRGTGAATLLGSHGVNDIFGLAFDTRNNVLYGSQFSGGSGLYSLSLTDGSATIINGSMNAGIGGLSYDWMNDRLVGMSDGAGDIYEIDRLTGAQSLLSNGPFVNDSGFTYDPDLDLYWDVDYSGNLYSYDPNNGFARTTRLTGLGNFDGMSYLTSAGNQSSEDVPVPASILLLGAGLLGLGLVRRRKPSA